MAKKIRLCVVTPSRTVFDDEVDTAILRTTEGDVGVLYGHIPLTTILSYGVLKIINNDNERIMAVHSGFAEILPNSVSVISESAEWPEEIDSNRAKAALERAEARLRQTNDSINIHRAELALRRALVRIEVSTYPLISKKGK